MVLASVRSAAPTSAKANVLYAVNPIDRSAPLAVSTAAMAHQGVSAPIAAMTPSTTIDAPMVTSSNRRIPTTRINRVVNGLTSTFPA